MSKLLPITFEGRADTSGCTFRQLKRDSGVCLYERKTPHGLTYEVVIARSHKKDRFLNGNKIAGEGDEYYPSASEFGIYGWHYPQIRLAEVRFEGMIKVQQAKARNEDPTKLLEDIDLQIRKIR